MEVMEDLTSTSSAVATAASFDPFVDVESQGGLGLVYQPHKPKRKKSLKKTKEQEGLASIDDIGASERSKKKKKKKDGGPADKSSNKKKKKSKKKKHRDRDSSLTSMNLADSNRLLACDTEPTAATDLLSPDTLSEWSESHRSGSKRSDGGWVEKLTDGSAVSASRMRNTDHTPAKSFDGSTDDSLDPYSVFGHIDDPEEAAKNYALVSSAFSPSPGGPSSLSAAIPTSTTSTHAAASPRKLFGSPKRWFFGGPTSSPGQEQPTFAVFPPESPLAMESMQHARLQKVQPAPTPTDQVSRDLLTMYMMSRGTNREEAEMRSEQFIELESTRRANKDRKSRSKNKRRSKAALLEPSPSNTQLDTSIPGYMRADEPGAMQMDGRAFGAPRRRQQRATEEAFMRLASCDVAFEVEAMPVKGNDEEILPYVYADSTPLSFKHMWREKYVRRAFCVAVLAISVIIGVVCYVVLRNTGSTIKTMSAPSMAPSSAPTIILDEFLEMAYTISRPEDVDTEGSPQRRAVAWLSTFDESGAVGSALIQRYTLLTFAYSLGSSEWLDPEMWLNPTLHECDWAQGISCETDLSGRRVVTVLDATRNGLKGILPAEISHLSDLEVLRLPKNPSMGGTLPDSIGDLSKLSDLDVSTNNLGGRIPSTIGRVRDLVDLNLSGNNFGASIPSELYALTFLRSLDLSENILTGTIQTEINNCKSLVTLDLKMNSFTGPWPVDLNVMPSLDTVSFDFNQLTGSLPVITDSLVTKLHISASHNNFEGEIVIDASALVVANVSSLRLQHVDISHNKLSGTLSRVLGFLPTLRHMDFSGNSFSGYLSGHDWQNVEFLAAGDNLFTGTLPVGWPLTLEHLDLSGNAFDSGGIPEELCGFTNLEFLLLDDNNLSSTIPSCLGDLGKIRNLELGNSMLVGTLPRSFEKLMALEILELQQNQLSGPIPAALLELTTLKQLRLDSNDLTGFVPAGLSELVDLRLLNLSFNQLVGDMPDLSALTKLVNLTLTGNDSLSGSVDGLCSESPGLILSTLDIGCNVVCSCCLDFEQVCSSF